MPSNRSTARRVARNLAGTLAVLSVTAPAAMAKPVGEPIGPTPSVAIAATPYVGHPLTDREPTRAAPASSYVGHPLTDRGPTPAAPASSYVAHPLADRTATHGPVVVSEPSSAGDGFDWGSAGIGGGVAAAAALALGAGLAFGPRRHSVDPL